MNWNKKHIDILDDELRRKRRNGEHDSLESSDSDAMDQARKDMFLLRSALRLEQIRENKKTLDEHRGSGLKQNKVVRMSKRRSLIISLTSAAAVVLALILFFPGGLGLFTQPEIRNQYLTDNFDAYLLHDITRNENNTDATTDTEVYAYSMFAMKEFKNAIPLLEQSWTEQNEPMALYYLILSHVALGEESTARDLFETNRNNLTPEMIELLERIY